MSSSYPSNEIADQIDDLCRGQREAQAWLYDTFGPLLYRRLKQRYVPMGLDADDLLQDAFVFFFQDNAGVLGRFKERLGPKSPSDLLDELERFLWNQACGIASNRLRSRRRDKSVPIGTVPDWFGDGTTEEQAVNKDSLERLDACLSHAQERVYLYYKLRFCDGLAPDQIQQATGWAKKMIYKLRERLNEAVGRCAERLGLKGGDA